MHGAQLIADRFELSDKLGEGGFGEVYRALDRETGEWVAVKILRGAAGEAEQRRFEVEAASLRRMRHPGCVAIKGFGATTRGGPYLVMELLQGISLVDVAVPIPLQRVVNIGIQVAEALAYAHKRQVVHRDIKPGNIFVTQQRGQEVVKLLDFGLAKLVDVARGPTRTGEYAGTPAYASPEHVGGLREVRASGDIYSLGVVLYELLEGCRPFDADNPVALAAAHFHMEPRPLSSGRPEALTELIMQMLAKAPEDRPTATGVAKRLRALVDHAAPATSVQHNVDQRAAPADPTTRKYQKPKASPLIWSVALGFVGTVGLFFMIDRGSTPAQRAPTETMPRAREARVVAAQATPTAIPAADLGRTDVDLVPAGCQKAPPTSDHLTVQLPTGEREAYLAVPHDYDADKRYPLLLGFHHQGLTRNIRGIDLIKDLDLGRVAQDAQVVVVALSSVERRRPWRGRDPDEQAMLAVLEEVERLLCVDREHISAIGMDAGAGMATRISTVLPLNTLIQIQHQVAVDDLDISLRAVQTKRVLRFHARRDRLVPSEGGMSCVPAEACGVGTPRSLVRGNPLPRFCGRRFLASQAEIRATWREHMQCRGDAAPWSVPGCEFESCEQGDVIWCATDGGHGVPGQRPDKFLQLSDCYVPPAEFPYHDAIVGALSRP